MSDLEPVLSALTEVRDEARAGREDDRAERKIIVDRLDQHEERLAQHGSALTTLGTEVASHTSQLAKLAESQISVARSASIAAELAATALSKVNSSQDETRKMVESAMSIQSTSIAKAVTDALGPVVNEIETLKKNDTAQTLTLAGQNTQLALVVSLLSQLASWKNHWAVKVAIVIAGIVGAGVAGYIGGR